jgi:hypothetical protein
VSGSTQLPPKSMPEGAGALTISMSMMSEYFIWRRA